MAFFSLSGFGIKRYFSCRVCGGIVFLRPTLGVLRWGPSCGQTMVWVCVVEYSQRVAGAGDGEAVFDSAVDGV